MKMLIIIIALGAIAYFAYQAMQGTQPDDKPVTEQALAKAPSVEAASGEEATDSTDSLVSSAAPNASVAILEPADGAVVSSPLTVKFGITNMSVAKAGDNQPNSGHHHLLINMDELPALDAPLPSTETLIHFGGAETEATIELTPGEHTLQLLLGNYLHIPHIEPVISEKITITVE